MLYVSAVWRCSNLRCGGVCGVVSVGGAAVRTVFCGAVMSAVLFVLAVWRCSNLRCSSVGNIVSVGGAAVH